jgi:hypothetical protein
MSSLFDDIKRQDAALRCSPELESKLLATLRQTARARKWRNRRKAASWVAIPVAAALALMVWLPRGGGDSALPGVSAVTSRPAGDPMMAAAPAEQADSAALSASVGGAAVSAPARTRVFRASRPSSARVIRGEEIRTDFFRLDVPPRVAGQSGGVLVRVEVPRAVMASFGIPVNEELLERPVTADLLIGEDGMARAIRFVRPAWQ